MNADGPGRVLAEPDQGTLFGFVDMFSGRQPVEGDDLRPGHHALHHARRSSSSC
ncbi:MAG: hypothetical protein M0C28_43265 [Candidatus Moduliflexus flocculans]|nr:hypothetical protein [Candidatus Moduliflexus flocculans]